MADRLDLVLVGADGGAGRLVGGLTLRAEQIVAEGDVAAGTLRSLRLRSGLGDLRLWAALTAEGWSNGQLMLTPPGDG